MENTQHELRTPQKRLAIASLVIGIVSIPTLGLLLVGGVTGLALGIVALRKIGKDPQHYAGRGLAIGGIATSALSLFLAIPALIAAIAIPNLHRSQQAAHEIMALHEVQEIGKAQIIYSQTQGAGQFADLKTLGELDLIDTVLASGEKGGYIFVSEPHQTSTGTIFDTTARPKTAGTFGTGNRSFGSNETMIVYQAEGDIEVRGTAENRRPANGTARE